MMIRVISMLISTSTQAIAVKAKLFRGFADPSRLTILESLRDSERTVSDVVEATGMSQSNVSNHMACLRDCGLVVAEQRGRYVYYRLSDARVDGLLALAETLLADVARGVYECTRYSTRSTTESPPEERHGSTSDR